MTGSWIVVCLVTLGMPDAPPQTPMVSWGLTVDAAKAGEALEPYRSRIVASAREALALPVVRRAKCLADVGQNRTWLDGRANALEPEIKEQFAFAMSDFAACNLLSGELPLLAAAYRMTGEAAFRDRVIAQLDEMASWSPLQRPGWTLYHPGARLPADGKDGSWLATGCGVRAIADTLDIMPEGSVEPTLRKRIDALLEDEIAAVVDDWATQRPWFVRSNDPITNQWVLPTEGLVRACLVLGPESHRDAYDLGVSNLLKALDVHGAAGEFEEGFGYASFTVTSMLNAARAMAVHGDRRAIDHPFLLHFPTWLVHHFQPGDMIVNCFDAGAALGGADRARPLLSMLAACTGSPVARWALAFQTDGPSDTLAGLVARTLPPMTKDAAPPLFACYERANRVNWRDSWRPDASGVWVRGGHPLDQHDHHDRGHVNFISKGRPILIEAGTPYYHHPLMGSHFASGAGHNVLQIGTAEPAPVNAGETLVLPGWQQRGVVAPLHVVKLDAKRGDVDLNITSGYDHLQSWSRHVTWSARKLIVRDHVQLAEGASEIILFRWHLGTDDPVAIESSESAWTAKWPDAVIRLKGSVPLRVDQVRMPDNTVNSVSDDAIPDPLHTCLVVTTASPAEALDLETEVKPQR